MSAFCSARQRFKSVFSRVPIGRLLLFFVLGGCECREQVRLGECRFVGLLALLCRPAVVGLLLLAGLFLCVTHLGRLALREGARDARAACGWNGERRAAWGATALLEVGVVLVLAEVVGGPAQHGRL